MHGAGCGGAGAHGAGCGGAGAHGAGSVTWCEVARSVRPCGAAPSVQPRTGSRAPHRASSTGLVEVGRMGRPYAGFCPAACTAVTAISLGPTLPSASSGLPEDSASSLSVLCLTLLRARFTERIRSPGPLVVSYTTVSPLPTLPPAVCFLWHCLADCSGWVLPTALLCGARTFLGTPGGVTRPSHRPIRRSECTGPVPVPVPVPARAPARAPRFRDLGMSARTRGLRGTSAHRRRGVVEPRRQRPGASNRTERLPRRTVQASAGSTVRRSDRPPGQALRAARVAAPMMPALLRSVAGMISACRSSSGRNSSYCFDTPPPTTKSSGESRASSVE
ncbi:hypothetical protein EDF31_10522 [Curtobacterium sp. PhB142]|nr:hypothetical protein EDF31_10522 [Curtobacterium sp. PhB142]TCM02059.1 hypothetical protein EDF26_105329 [Curtobacterium sp. PhB134]